MEIAIEYNKIALSDVKTTLSVLKSTEQTKLSFETANAGETFDKINEYAMLYNTLGDCLCNLIQQTESLVENVLNAVHEVDEA